MNILPTNSVSYYSSVNTNFGGAVPFPNTQVIVATSSTPIVVIGFDILRTGSNAQELPSLDLRCGTTSIYQQHQRGYSGYIPVNYLCSGSALNYYRNGTSTTISQIEVNYLPLGESALGGITYGDTIMSFFMFVISVCVTFYIVMDCIRGKKIRN